jgi:hypothetical protein
MTTTFLSLIIFFILVIEIGEIDGKIKLKKVVVIKKKNHCFGVTFKLIL